MIAPIPFDELRAGPTTVRFEGGRHAPADAGPVGASFFMVRTPPGAGPVGPGRACAAAGAVPGSSHGSLPAGEGCRGVAGPRDGRADHPEVL